jgi:GTP cyclohydrolase IA
MEKRMAKRGAFSRTISNSENAKNKKPTRLEAEDAVRTLIRWAGDDPYREGMKGTPERVIRAYEEWFAGYADNPLRSSSRSGH